MPRALQTLPADAAAAETESPVGTLTIVASPRALHALLWDIDQLEEPGRSIVRDLPRKPDEPLVASAVKQLAEYFAGTRKAFDLPLALEGTDFEKSVWAELRKIPYGRTISYGEQTMRVAEDMLKVRAVAAANGRNPICIVVPCHRVIGANGELVGFGGGLTRKQRLLDLERGQRSLFEH